jgi:ribose transport system substrate-binding protein
LIGGINDPSSLGGLQAYEEAGRAETCLVVGQNATIEARLEMRKRGSRFVGSVAYFPENYGEAILGFAIDILRGKEVPPALFTKHRMVTGANVDEIYPNDRLTTAEGTGRIFRSGG